MLKRIARLLCPKLPDWRWRLGRAFQQATQDWPLLGWKLTAQIARNTCLGYRHNPKIDSTRLRDCSHPFFYRPESSDPFIIRQVYVKQEYDCVGYESDVRYILDCGANIGCTSFFFLHRYPQAQVIAVEPDAENMNLCRRNLAPFQDRAMLVQTGIWSSSGPMVVERGKYRDGSACSFQVRPVKTDEQPDFQAMTIDELLAQARFPRIDILKVDIETAEREVFRIGCSTWLDKTKTLVIELHDSECAFVVEAALNGCQYVRELSGELTVYRNIQRQRLPNG